MKWLEGFQNFFSNLRKFFKKLLSYLASENKFNNYTTEYEEDFIVSSS